MQAAWVLDYIVARVKIIKFPLIYKWTNPANPGPQTSQDPESPRSSFEAKLTISNIAARKRTGAY